MAGTLLLLKTVYRSSFIGLLLEMVTHFVSEAIAKSDLIWYPNESMFQPLYRIISIYLLLLFYITCPLLAFPLLNVKRVFLQKEVYKLLVT